MYTQQFVRRRRFICCQFSPEEHLAVIPLTGYELLRHSKKWHKRHIIRQQSTTVHCDELFSCSLQAHRPTYLLMHVSQQAPHPVKNCSILMEQRFLPTCSFQCHWWIMIRKKMISIPTLTTCLPTAYIYKNEIISEEVSAQSHQMPLWQ